MSHGAVVVTQLVVFLVKVFLVCSFQILVRWTLPRFRWDQVLRFAWKFMFPLALANLVVTAIVMWATAMKPAAMSVPGRPKRESLTRSGKVSNEPQTLRSQAVLERTHDGLVGARVPVRDPARAVDHRRRLHAQHVALGDRTQGRADHLLPRGNALGLRRRQPRQSTS